MKATNQKDQTVEILKFSGILLVSLILMGFAFFGGTKVLPEAEKENLQAKLAALEDSIASYDRREKRMAAVLYYADSLYQLLDTYNKLERELIELRTGQLAAGDPLIETQALQIKGRMDVLIENMGAVQARLRDARYQEHIPYLPVNLVDESSSNFLKALGVIMAEKRFKQLTLLGNSSAASQNINQLEEENQKLQDELAQQQTQNQFESQLTTLQANSQACSEKLSACEARLAARNQLLMQCNTLLSTLGPGLNTHSTNLTTHTSGLTTVTNTMGVNQKNENTLRDLIQKYNALATELKQSADKVNALAAQLR